MCVCLAVLHGAPVVAQTTGGTTMWSFLGVPNPFTLNQVDQQSSNPAIAAAAKAKAAKHAICKKKKALEYLGDMGCTPEHPEVMPALMAAMDDPDEQVRYEAVKSVLKSTAACQSKELQKSIKKGKSHSEAFCDKKKAYEKKLCESIDRLCGKAPPKQHEHKVKKKLQSMIGREECPDPSKEDCPQADKRGNCCSPAMREKLLKLAYGRDDQGCFVEPSKRVRDLAAQAVQACNACAGECEACGGMPGGGITDRTVREMPPETPRETTPVGVKPSSDCDCMPGVPLPRSVMPLPPAGDMPEHLPPVEAVPTPADPEPLTLPPPADGASAELRSVLIRDAAPPLWTPSDPVLVFADRDEVLEFLAALERPADAPAHAAPASPFHAAALRRTEPLRPVPAVVQPPRSARMPSAAPVPGPVVPPAVVASRPVPSSPGPSDVAAVPVPPVPQAAAVTSPPAAGVTPNDPWHDPAVQTPDAHPAEPFSLSGSLRWMATACLGCAILLAAWSALATTDDDDDVGQDDPE